MLEPMRALDRGDLKNATLSESQISRALGIHRSIREEWDMNECTRSCTQIQKLLDLYNHLTNHEPPSPRTFNSHTAHAAGLLDICALRAIVLDLIVLPDLSAPPSCSLRARRALYRDGVR